MLWPLIVLFLLASGTMLVLGFCRCAAQLPPVRTREDLERETVEWDAWEEENERRERRTS